VLNAGLKYNCINSDYYADCLLLNRLAMTEMKTFFLNFRISRSLFVLIVGSLMFTANLSAQEKPKGREQQRKELKKKKEKQMEKQKKAEVTLKKRHMDIQDKETRRRMKKAKKQSDKLNRSKRRH